MNALFRQLLQRSNATFSPDRRFRYTLTRTWSDARPFVVIGVNPSTADDTVDDPTIRRCVSFAADHGCGSLHMLNAFAYRSTDVRVLGNNIGDVVGPDNNDAILRTVALPDALVVCAWGARGKVPPWLRCRFAEVTAIVRTVTTTHALSVTKDGDPAHPLYLPASCRAAVWP